MGYTASQFYFAIRFCIFLSNQNNQIFIILEVLCRSEEQMAGPFSAASRMGNITPKKSSQRIRAVGNTLSNLTSPGFKPQTSRTNSNAFTIELTAGYIVS